MEKQKFINGISYHCVKVYHKDNTIEDIFVSDELDEDCNAYELKERILKENVENSIKKISIINTKNVKFDKKDSEDNE